MNKKSKKILIIVVLIIIIVEIFSYLKYNPTKSTPNKVEEKTEPKAILEKNVKVSLVVQEKKYEGEFKDGITVFEVMRKIKEENKDFDFKYGEFTGLGIFINEINGLKGGSEGYWIYYLNDKEANVGVSNYKIKEGDIISWKYEK
ncbi:MAG: DUF4430 domain-containing protein [Candidatus Paceibacterota bacterium]